MSGPQGSEIRLLFFLGSCGLPVFRRGGKPRALRWKEQRRSHRSGSKGSRVNLGSRHPFLIVGGKSVTTSGQYARLKGALLMSFRALL